MLRYVPDFIREKASVNLSSGSFFGYVLYADIADFTSLTNIMRKEGKKGAEALNHYLTYVLSYPIELVEKHGGFISHFAGDAFFAVFPHADVAQIKFIVCELTSYFAENHTCQTEIGDYPLNVRIVVSKGKVNWHIYKNAQQAEYVFSGKPFQEISALSGEKLELALSPEIQAAFDGVEAQAVEVQPNAYQINEQLLRQFLNARLHDLMPENEIRDAVYCFISMSSLDEEQIEQVLYILHDKLDSYGGYLNKLDAGDKGLVAFVLFGMPRAIGNTLERACRFALEVIEQEPKMAIGLSCGTAYAGFVGSDTTREYTALGSAVNLASRLMQASQPGDILTDAYLEQEMHHKYRFEAAGSVSLKGFASEVHSNRLIERLSAQPQSFLTELVGRDEELLQIRAEVDKAGSRIIYVSGEPGLGKSRLIQEALQAYPKRYFLYCDPSGHKHLEPIKQLLRQCFAYDPLLSREQNQRSFHAKWSELAGENKELLRIESIIGNLLGFNWEGSVWSVLPPEEKPEQQRKAFATLLARITESERVIIHLDDPQWLEARDIEYFRQLGAVKLDGIVIIAACRYREDGKPVNLEMPNWDAMHLDLNRLSEAAAATLINHLLKMEIIPQETLDWIIRKADGNPLFIEQVVAYLKENDCFDSEYKLKGNLDYLSSFGIADIIGSRIDSLTDSVRNTLQHACILGLEFNTRVLSEMLSRKLDDDLGEGKQARVWADIDELRYIFTHVLIKDTAYNRMLSDKLKKLHLLAAETMEQLYQDDEKALNEHSEEIAKHFESAGEEEKAAEYFDRAGCWYKEHYDWEKSEENLRKALIKREIVLGEEHRKTAYTLDSLGRLFYMRGINDQAECYYLRSLAILERVMGGDHPDTARVLINLAALYEEQCKYAQAEQLNLQGLNIIEKQLGAEHPETATSLNNLALVYYTLGKYTQAENLYTRALAINNKAFGVEHESTANVLNNLAVLYTTQGRFDQAEPVILRALAIREKVLGTHHPITSQSLSSLGMLYENQGKYSQAVGLWIKVLDIREKVLGTDHPETAKAMHNLANLYSSLGKFDKAELLHLQALAIRERVVSAEHSDIASSLNSLAVCYLRQGKHEQAEPLCRRSCALNERALGAEHPTTAISLNNLAGVYRDQKKHVLAEPLYLRVLEILEKALGLDHPNTATAMHNLACVYKEIGDYVQAERWYLRASVTRIRILGVDHPSTQTTIDRLVDTYEKLNQPEKAAEYRAMLINSKGSG